jgi:hypothetical protein
MYVVFVDRETMIFGLDTEPAQLDNAYGFQHYGEPYVGSINNFENSNNEWTFSLNNNAFRFFFKSKIGATEFKLRFG